MFNIKNLVNKIADRTPKELQPNSPARQVPPFRGEFERDGNQESAEGFLCPTCMQDFSSPEELQLHYQTFHQAASDCSGSGNQDALRPVRNGGALEGLKQEVAELSTTLKEERWYSEELKREVERLQSVVTEKIGNTEEGELHNHHIKALEENKSLLTSEVILLRQQLTEARDSISIIKQEKEMMEQKAANLATVNVNLKAAIDEGTSQIVALEERLKLMENDLAHKNSIDDTAVLRQELVQVQKMMDELTQQREQERDQLQSRLQELQSRFGVLQAEKDSLKESLDKAPTQEELVSLKAMLSQNSSGTEEIQHNLQQKNQVIMELQNKLQEVSEELQRMQIQLAEERSCRQREETQSQTLGEEVQNVKQELEEKIQEQISLQEKMKETLNAYEATRMEADSLKKSLSIIKSDTQQEMSTRDHCHNEMKLQLESLNTQLQGKEGQISDLIGQLATLQGHYDEQCKVNDELKGHIFEKQQAFEEEHRQRDGRERKLKELKTSLTQVKDQIIRLEGERTELLAKIEAGEGVSTAIQQLKQENSTLQQQLEKQEEASSCQQEKMTKKLDELHQQLQETKTQLNGACDKACRLEASLQDESDKHAVSQAKVLQLESDLKNKAELIVAIEAAKVSQRTDLENHLRCSQTVLQEKCGELDRVQQKLEQKNSEISAQKEDLVKVEGKLKETQEKGNLLQAKCKKLQEEVQAKSGELKAVETTLQSVKLQSEDSQKKLTHYQDQIIVKERKLNELAKELDDWKSKSGKLADSVKQIDLKRTELDTKLKEKETTVKELRALLETSEKNVMDTKKELHFSKDKEQNLRASISEQEKTISTLLEEKTNLEAALQNVTKDMDVLSVQKNSLETSIFELQKKLSDREETVTELLNKVHENEAKYRMEKEEKNKEISTLTEAKQLLISQKVDLQNQVAAVEEQLQKEKMNSENQEQKLQLEIRTLQEERCHLKEDLSSETAAKSSLQQELEQTVMRYNMQLTTVNENLATLRTDFLAKQLHADELQLKVDELSGDKLELEAKLENAQDERRALLERCLASESECEKLGTTTVELRRKLDDSQAALHELGRENQTLQMEIAKSQGRKWAEDGDVTQCSSCQMEFSLTLRKHHCRNCGQIFCNDCSSKSATVASSKKPVRVCDGCYNEIMNK